MTSKTWLIRSVAGIAAIAATGAAHAADGAFLAQARGSQADPPCRTSGLSHAPIGVAEQAPGRLQSTMQEVAGGYASPKDAKLIFACPNRLVPTV